eukprot:scaffold1401_cov330-Pavlova_lutheri.AAC.24
MRLRARPSAGGRPRQCRTKAHRGGRRLALDARRDDARREAAQPSRNHYEETRRSKRRATLEEQRKPVLDDGRRGRWHGKWPPGLVGRGRRRTACVADAVYLSECVEMGSKGRSSDSNACRRHSGCTKAALLRGKGQTCPSGGRGGRKRGRC